MDYVCHLRTASDESNVALTIITAPLPMPKTRLKNEANEEHRNKADDTTQPTSGHLSHWVPNAASRGLGALLPGLATTCCIVDGCAHTDIMASIAPKGTQREQKEKRYMEGRRKGKKG